ncbi:hypothetical protein N2152v2_009340 [Parachlorella kessleri]
MGILTLRPLGPSAGQRQIMPESFTTAAPRTAAPVVVLPGFGNCARDYQEPFGDADAGIVAALKRRGFQPYVLPIERSDWLQVGRALLTRAYWAGSCTTHPGYSFYLERLKQLVDKARLETGCDQVDLVAHSAGGWLGRAFIGQQQYKGGTDSSDDEPHEAVRALVTLGTPHTGTPAEKGRCRTGGALSWVNSMWPGAYFADQGVKYVSVGSRAVVGDATVDRRTLPGYAHGSYMEVRQVYHVAVVLWVPRTQAGGFSDGLSCVESLPLEALPACKVCGEGHGVEGDAVVPLKSALLEGSEHVVLDHVLHSMSRIRTFGEKAETEWYGSDSVVDSWLHHLV